MLQNFLVHTLDLPQPVAAWLSAFFDALSAMAITPAGILFAVVFLFMGYLRIGTIIVASSAGVVALALAQLRLQVWANYSDDWRMRQMIVLTAAALVLCLTAHAIGRWLRPHYF